MNIHDKKIPHIEYALQLLKKSYSPYSKFKVACVSVSKDNKIIEGGVNVENISYGLTICAERNMIHSMITKGISFKNIDYIILVNSSQIFITPCGACLQVLSEFLPKTIQMFSAIKSKDIIKTKSYTLQNLFPTQFKFQNK